MSKLKLSLIQILHTKNVTVIFLIFAVLASVWLLFPFTIISDDEKLNAVNWRILVGLVPVYVKLIWGSVQFINVTLNPLEA